MSRGHRRHAGGGARAYSRMARVNELCHQIVADELERIDDERLELVTVTHVEVDPDLRRATVEFTSLADDDGPVTEALAEHRVKLQGAIGRQARLKRTPELQFRPDDVIRTGVRIEQLLREVTGGDDDRA